MAERAPAGKPADDGAAPFWETVPLETMSDVQWESLCDGCGRCCLHKLEDEDTGEVHFTSIACRQLDTSSCRCRDYEHRFEHVPDCLSVRPLDGRKLGWLPGSCAYRRLANGHGLPDWHPLVTGRAASTAEAGIAVRHRARSELEVPVHEWVEHVIEWADAVPGGSADASVNGRRPGDEELDGPERERAGRP